ncbi:hypothetical protein V6N13_025600 [Hibiscus sabdariffa]|uniref:JmjC domain-containing protein n=1 Tax=Hibiscus sabdariffa TaxID=183260 RepID=A0ABR2C9V6_9ROSI
MPEQKTKKKKEYGIEPWSFVHKLGEAVFIPAGCPPQVWKIKEPLGMITAMWSVRGAELLVLLIRWHH